MPHNAAFHQPHNAAFHQGLHYLLRQNRISEKEIQYITCDSSIYKFMENSIT